MLAGALVTGFESLVSGEPAGFNPAAVSGESIIALVYLVLFGSMLAYTSYAWLLRNAPLSLVGTYAYVNPVVAVGLGTIFLHEPISFRTIVASGGDPRRGRDHRDGARPTGGRPGERRGRRAVERRGGRHQRALLDAARATRPLERSRS